MSSWPRHTCKINLLTTCSKFWLVAFLAAIFVSPLPAANEPARVQPPLDKSKARDLLRSLAFFERNEGQVDDRVLFLTQGLGYAVYLTRDGATLVFSESSRSANGRATSTEKVVRLNIIGIDAHPEVIGSEQRPGVTSYFSGADPKQWHTRVPQFAKVIYRHAYPGIDLVFKIRDGRLEYDFLIAPHADPNLIRVNVEGGTPHRTATGDVLVRFGKHNDFTLKKPDAYQPGNKGHEDQVTNVRYSLLGRDMAFALNNYNHDLPLVIDPALIFSTFLTSNCPVSTFDPHFSTCSDFISDLTVDSTGIYLAGGTNAISFPGGTTPGPGSRSFVVKLDPNATTVLYMVFLGIGEADSVAVDASHSAYVTGVALFPKGADTFPTTPGSFSPLPTNACSTTCRAPYASKLSPDGATLQYSTLLQLFAPGGQSNIIYEIIQPVRARVDAAGAFYVTGKTDAGPTANPPATYTLIGSFPATVGAYQPAPPPHPIDLNHPTSGFVMKLNPSGSALSYATFLGEGYYPVQVTGLDVDSSGSAYVAGYAGSFFPTTPGAFQTTNADQTTFAPNLDGFVSKLSPDGGSLVYSTYFGGPGNDFVNGIAVDTSGQATIAGWGPNPPGSATNCPPASLQNHLFISRFNAAGSALIYNASFCSQYVDGFTDVALDNSGNAYAVGEPGDPAVFPLTNPIQAYLSSGLSGSPDAIMKLDNAGAIVWATFFGNVLPGINQRIAVDPSANAYVLNGTGPTTANALQRNPGLPQDPTPFLAKIAPSLGAAVMIVTPAGTLDQIAVPQTVTFGDQLIGTSSASSDVQVGNFGDANLAPTISITGDFSQTNTCTAPIPAGQKCDINVVFKPTALGNRTGTLTVSASGQTTQVIQLTGNGTAPAETFSPTALAFEPQLTGTTSLAMSVQISNTGTGPLTITSLQTTGDFAQSNACGSPVAPVASCTVQVTFTPTAFGNRTGVLTVTDNAAGSPHTLALSGQGTSQQASVNPTSLTFVSQPVGASSTGAVVTLHNSGTTALTISSISAAGDFAQTNNCGASLTGSMDCQITVTFTPAVTGNRTGTLSIADSSSGSPQTVSLSGTGTDFSVVTATGGAGSATVTAGQPATYNLQLSPTGFSGTIALTCTGAPAGATCTPNPATLTTNGSSPVSFAVNVTTQAHSGFFRFAPESFRQPPISPFVLTAWSMLLALLLAATALSKRPVHVRVKSARFLGFAAAAIFLVACGGGATTTPPNVGTQKGTYTLVLTAKSSTLTHTMNLTLTVN
jgi:Abnormal spindle-like microcephaly-assoc'd, ASPM-SPD-2-Hydin/Beta-propeller repeat